MSVWRVGKRKRLPSSAADVDRGMETKQSSLFCLDEIYEKFSSPTASQDENYVQVEWDGRPELERLSQAPGAIADVMAKCSAAVVGSQPATVLEIADGSDNGSGKGSGSSPVIQFLYLSPNQNSLLATPTRSPLFTSKRRSRLAIHDHKLKSLSASSRNKSSADMLQRVMSIFDSLAQQKEDPSEAMKDSSSGVRSTSDSERGSESEKKVDGIVRAQSHCNSNSDELRCNDEQVSYLDDSLMQNSRDEDAWTDDDVFANESFIRATQCIVDSEVCLSEPSDDKPALPQASSTPGFCNKSVSKLGGIGSTVRQTLPARMLVNNNAINPSVNHNSVNPSTSKNSACTSSANRILSSSTAKTSLITVGSRNLTKHNPDGCGNNFSFLPRHGSSDAGCTRMPNRSVPFKSKSDTDFNGTFNNSGKSYQSQSNNVSRSATRSTFSNIKNSSFSTKRAQICVDSTSESILSTKNIACLDSKQDLNANVRRLSASLQNVEVSEADKKLGCASNAKSDKQQTESVEHLVEMDISFSDKILETFVEPDDILDSQLCKSEPKADSVREKVNKDVETAEVQAHASFADEDDLMTEPEVLAFLDDIEYSATQGAKGVNVQNFLQPPLPQLIQRQSLQTDRQRDSTMSVSTATQNKTSTSSAILSSTINKGFQSGSNPSSSNVASSSSVRVGAVNNGFIFSKSVTSNNLPINKFSVSCSTIQSSITNNSTPVVSCDIRDVNRTVETEVVHRLSGLVDSKVSYNINRSNVPLAKCMSVINPLDPSKCNLTIPVGVNNVRNDSECTMSICTNMSNSGLTKMVNPVLCGVASLSSNGLVSSVKSFKATSSSALQPRSMNTKPDCVNIAKTGLISVSSVVTVSTNSCINVVDNYRNVTLSSDGAKRFSARPATTGSIQNYSSVVAPGPGSQPSVQSRVNQPVAGRKYTLEEIELKRQEALRKRQLSMIKS